jgi:hypothetical protein
MLLIDGVRYELWTPPSEDEFERVVEKHAEEIFGKDAKYFDLKHKLASRSGTGSIPDGYVINLGDKPKVQIIEFELESHSLQHIVSQMVNIINGIENPTTQQKICNAIEDGINEDEIFTAKIMKAIKPVAVHRFLSDNFSNMLPTIYIIIDKSWPALEEAMNKIAPSPKIIEFQTFTREGVAGLAVHAHLFEPLYKPVTPPKPELPTPQLPENSFEVTLQPSYIESYCVYIPAANKHRFPTINTTLEVDTNVGLIEASFVIDSFGIWLSKGLSKWFKANPELKKGDKVRISVIESMKKYRLEIVK